VLEDTVAGDGALEKMKKAVVMWNLIIKAAELTAAEQIFTRFVLKNTAIEKPKIRVMGPEIPGHYMAECLTSIVSFNSFKKWLAQLTLYAPHWHLANMRQTPDTYEIQAHQSAGIKIPNITFIHSHLHLSET